MAMQEEIGATVQLSQAGCYLKEVTHWKYHRLALSLQSTTGKGRRLQNLGMSHHHAPTGLKSEPQNELLCSYFVCRAFCILRIFQRKEAYSSSGPGWDLQTPLFLSIQYIQRLPFGHGNKLASVPIQARAAPRPWGQKVRLL